MSSTATVLAWGGIAFKDGYLHSFEYENLLNEVYWVAEYLIKCHTKPHEFYGQVGTSYLELGQWTRPEENTNSRMAYKIDEKKPGSDLAGEASAAFSAISFLMRDEDPYYSEILAMHASELYQFADSKRSSENENTIIVYGIVILCEI